MAQLRSITAVAAFPLFLFGLRSVEASEAVVVSPHPGAGKFVLQQNSDRPLLAAYGGIGLKQQPDGSWTGYGEQTEQDVDYLIRRCQQHGLRRLHPSILEALYPVVGRSEPTPESYQLVEYLFSEAHANGIEVFADMPAFAYFVAADEQFAKAHPYCFTRSHSGELDTHMLSAAYPEVRKYRRSMFLDLVERFPVDGLHLDFIRFPYYQKDLREGFGKHGYDAPALAAFRQHYGLGNDFVPEPDDERWVRWKASLVSLFIQELRADLAASGVELPIAVYNSVTYSRADSLRTVHQNWEVWETERLVDEHHPMILMSAGATHLTRTTQSLLDIQQKGSKSRVFGPIFLAEGFDVAGGDRPTPDKVRDAARRLIKMGCDSLWFCRVAEIEEFGLWPVVEEISNWSLSEIRKEEFDPYHENIAADPDFSAGNNHWKYVGQSADGTAIQPIPGGLSITLSDSATRGVEQTIAFRPIKHLPVHSLRFATRIAVSPDCVLDGKIELKGTLRYANGRETHWRKPVVLAGSTGSISHVVEVDTDFEELVLESATFALDLPRGKGTLHVDEVVVERDPLFWSTIHDRS